MPSLTFVATVNAVRYAGATPVFADVESLERPWLSAEAVGIRGRAIGTRAVMNMTYGGHPARERPARRALRGARTCCCSRTRRTAWAAASMAGALGTFGLAGAFSFFSNKNLPVGEGGMVVTGDDEVSERVRLLRSHGMTSLTWDRHRGHASGYDVVALGFNYRIDEPRAALATARLERLDGDNEARAVAAGVYRERLSNLDDVLVTMPEEAGGRSAHHLFTVVLGDGTDRDGVREAMAEGGIQTSLHYPPVHRFSAYDEAVELPVTEDYARRSVTLPLFPTLTEEGIGMVVDGLADALSGG